MRSRLTTFLLGCLVGCLLTIGALVVCANLYINAERARLLQEYERDRADHERIMNDFRQQTEAQLKEKP